MSEASKKANADKRKLEKQERKKANIAKVEASKAEKKRKTVWELLEEDRAGGQAVEQTSEDGETTKKKVKVRKVLLKNRLSHRRTNKRAKPVCVQVLGGKIVRVSHEEATELVAKGGKYVPKRLWREQVRAKVA